MDQAISDELARLSGADPQKWQLNDNLEFEAKPSKPNAVSYTGGPSSSYVGDLARAARDNIGSVSGGLGVGSALNALGLIGAPETGGASLLLNLLGLAVGSTAGASLGNKIQRELAGAEEGKPFEGNWMLTGDVQREKEHKEHPSAQLLGGLVPMAVGARPTLSTLKNLSTAIPNIVRGKAQSPEQIAALGNAAVNTAIQGYSTASRLREGEKVNPLEEIAGAGSGLLFGSPRWHPKTELPVTVQPRMGKDIKALVEAPIDEAQVTLKASGKRALDAVDNTPERPESIDMQSMLTRSPDYPAKKAILIPKGGKPLTPEQAAGLVPIEKIQGTLYVNPLKVDQGDILRMGSDKTVNGKDLGYFSENKPSLLDASKTGTVAVSTTIEGVPDAITEIIPNTPSEIEKVMAHHAKNYPGGVTELLDPEQLLVNRLQKPSVEDITAAKMAQSKGKVDKTVEKQFTPIVEDVVKAEEEKRAKAEDAAKGPLKSAFEPTVSDKEAKQQAQLAQEVTDLLEGSSLKKASRVREMELEQEKAKDRVQQQASREEQLRGQQLLAQNLIKPTVQPQRVGLGGGVEQASGVETGAEPNVVQRKGITEAARRDMQHALDEQRRAQEEESNRRYVEEGNRLAKEEHLAVLEEETARTKAETEAIRKRGALPPNVPKLEPREVPAKLSTEEPSKREFFKPTPLDVEEGMPIRRQKVKSIPASTLEERQLADPNYSKAQEDTPEFRRWFEGSKVVDKEGSPKVIYHGTQRAGFNVFYPESHFGTSEQANKILTIKDELRKGFSKAANIPTEELAGKTISYGDADSIYPVYLSIKNPKLVHDVGHNWDYEVKLAKLGGYDGLVYDNQAEGKGLSYVPFYPEQIKSATGNKGTFDFSSPNIKYSKEMDVDEGTPIRGHLNAARNINRWSADMGHTVQEAPTGPYTTEGDLTPRYGKQSGVKGSKASVLEVSPFAETAAHESLHAVLHADPQFKARLLKATGLTEEDIVKSSARSLMDRIEKNDFGLWNDFKNAVKYYTGSTDRAVLERIFQNELVYGANRPGGRVQELGARGLADKEEGQYHTVEPKNTDRVIDYNKDEWLVNLKGKNVNVNPETAGHIAAKAGQLTAKAQAHYDSEDSIKLRPDDLIPDYNVYAQEEIHGQDYGDIGYPKVRGGPEDLLDPNYQPAINSVINKIPSTKGKKAMEDAYNEKQFLKGKLAYGMVNKLTAFDRSLVNEVADKHSEYYENDTPVTLNKKEQEVSKILTDKMEEIKDLQNSLGYERDIVGSPYYIPKMIGPDVIELSKKGIDSPEMKEVEQTIANYWDERGMPDADKEARQYLLALSGAKGGLLGSEEVNGFAALHRAAGYGLPDETPSGIKVKEPDALRALTRYGEMAAADMAWQKNVKNVLTPEELTSLESKKDGPWQVARELYFNPDPVRHPIAKAASKFFSAAAIGPISKSFEVLSNPHNAMLYGARPADIARGIKNVVMDWTGSKQKAAEGGIIKPGGVMDDNYGSNEARDIAGKISTIGDVLYKYEGNDFQERLSRTLSYAFSEETALARQRDGDKKWFAERGVDINDPDAVKRAATQMSELIQGRKDSRELPEWMLKGTLADIAPIHRWAVGHSGNILREIGNGNYSNLVYYMLAGLGVGLGRKELNKFITGRKGNAATVGELEASGKGFDSAEGARYVTDVLRNSGIGGALTDLADYSVNAYSGRQPQIIFNPLATTIKTGLLDMPAKLLEAVDEGIPPLEASRLLVDNVFRNVFQVWRVAEELAKSPEQTFRDSNRRDLREYRILTGNTKPFTGDYNPALAAKSKAFQEAETPQETREAFKEFEPILRNRTTRVQVPRDYVMPAQEEDKARYIQFSKRAGDEDIGEKIKRSSRLENIRDMKDLMLEPIRLKQGR